MEGDQGKRKFVLPKKRTEHEALPRISPFLEGAAVSEPLRRQHGESLSVVYCLVMCPQQSPGHPPLSSSSPP